MTLHIKVFCRRCVPGVFNYLYLYISQPFGLDLYVIPLNKILHFQKNTHTTTSNVSPLLCPGINKYNKRSIILVPNYIILDYCV